MIKYNDKEILVNHFPDGTQCLMGIDVESKNGVHSIEWTYSSDEELATLLFLVGHIRSHSMYPVIKLYMKYIPNARMDRVKNDDEVFTLKYFCQFINSLNFDQVVVLDPHSNVSEALLDRMCKINEASYLTMAINRVAHANGIDTNDVVLYFPDAGAMKRYSGAIDDLGKFDVCYGEKVRDWRTGNIKGLTIKTERKFSLTDRVVLMIDDIISYGGTMYYSALELEKLALHGSVAIYAYATHVENSVLNTEKGKFIKLLDDRTVISLYTTNSIYSGNNKNIIIL